MKQPNKPRRKILFRIKEPRFYLRCCDCDNLIGVIMDSNIQKGWILCNKCLKIRIRLGDVNDTTK